MPQIPQIIGSYSTHRFQLHMSYVISCPGLYPLLHMIDVNLARSERGFLGLERSSVTKLLLVKPKTLLTEQ